MRLDKFLSSNGLGSRKDVKNLIKNKRVSVNEIIINDDSYSIDPNKDIIKLDNNTITYKEFYYVLLNKPKGCVSAVEDSKYKTVVDLIGEYKGKGLYPVGRLDLDTTGTLLLSNNGPLCHKLLSSKYHVDKTYYVTTDKEIKEKMIDEFKKGILIEDEITLPADLKIIDSNHAELTIHQGRFHQVKRMFEYFGIKVVELDRLSFAFLNHEGLKPGEYRELTSEEEEKILTL